MEILEKIYERHIAGELDTAPENVLSAVRPRVEALKEQCGMSAEQADELEELILDAAAQYGKEMFFAGFGIASKKS